MRNDSEVVVSASLSAEEISRRMLGISLKEPAPSVGPCFAFCGMVLSVLLSCVIGAPPQHSAKRLCAKSRIAAGESSDFERSRLTAISSL